MEINSAEYTYNPITNTKDGIKAVINGTMWIIPLDEANSDYQLLMEWVAEGNTITDNGGSE